jgi:zinc transporter, ZIP family
VALVAAFAFGNFAEGLSSTAGMLSAGRTRRYVFLLWTGVAIVTAGAAVLGYAVFTGGGGAQGWLESIAAGALIALVVETMTPEAVHGQPRFSGLLAMLGLRACCWPWRHENRCLNCDTGEPNRKDCPCLTPQP